VSTIRPDPIEEAVIARLSGLLGGTPRRIDDGTADGVHDYEIDLANGRVIAVEITGQVDDAVRATNAATRRHRLTNSGVRSVWDISLADWNAHRARLAKRLPAMLIEYETNDRSYVTASADPRLAALGIAAAERRDDLRGSGIYLTHVGPGGSIGPIDVLDAVNDHGTRVDNVAKLTRAAADERHLALWVDVTSSDVFAALNDFGLLPGEEPAVDAVIDSVWAMRVDATDTAVDIDVVWCWKRGEGWSYQGRSPVVVSDDP
jgi:hypothetical protein